MKDLSGFHICEYTKFEREFSEPFGKDLERAFILFQDLYPMDVCVISIYREAVKQNKVSEVLDELDNLAHGEEYNFADLYPPTFSSACFGEKLETPYQLVKRKVCDGVLSLQTVA
ncbi:MAG: hypothetical protein Q7S53_01960 [bacterium]|nr:hypothetical protein [bacterium]